MIGDDKRTVQKIECKPIGGLKFVWQLERDLKSAHGDDKFISQFFGINRANIDTWPQLRHFARHFVRGSPSDRPEMIGTRFAFGMVRSATFIKRRI